ncbi:MAG: hypothetical protein D6701_11940 [Gemmatimonadetes bacterium]|nr:MAG: hypothetical protein D6701_11940 [Gemmatimonadota bacterium]
MFVGEEDFQNIGVMHVVDVRDLTQPREVATFAVPGQTPHNFWLDEANQVLYAAWYDQGLRALDVSGRLLGRLERQGREYTPTFFDRPPGPGGAFTWAPQLHGGLVYASDISLGLLVVTPPL